MLKQLSISPFLLALGVAPLCHAALPVPSSLVAEPHQRDPYDWNARHQAVKNYVGKVKPEYVAIGDSITHHWGGEPSLGSAKRASGVWNSLFGNHTVANMGFGFDYIDNAYYRIQDGELAGHSPRVIIVLLGTNNLGHRKDSPRQCAAHMKAFLELLRQEAPASKILLLGILPRKEKELAEPISATNKLYRQLADNKSVYFLDVAKGGRKAASWQAECLRDFVHPNKAGYLVMASAIKRELRRIDPQF